MTVVSDGPTTVSLDCMGHIAYCASCPLYFVHPLPPILFKTSWHSVLHKSCVSALSKVPIGALTDATGVARQIQEVARSSVRDQRLDLLH